MSVPIVAIIGRPNVGKSTLFNRIIRKPLAITDDRPGVTRDRNARIFEWNSRAFMLIDTGGFVFSSRDTMEQAVAEQSRLAIDEAHLVLFLVDVKSGVTDLDGQIADMLLKSGKPVVLGVNKVDRRRDESDAYEFYNLGLGEPMPVSGATGRGTGDLLDALVDSLPAETENGVDDAETLKIALIGRPNVGKSSIVNSLTGRNSVLVTDVPGTTRDSIDTVLTYDDRKIILVDTAGLRKTTKLRESLEYYSSLRTIRSLNRCDIAIVVIDIDEGLTSYDKRLVDDAEDAGKGIIIAANKWDLVPKDHSTLMRYERDIYDAFPDKKPYPVMFVSALNGKRIGKLIETAAAIDGRRRFRVQTADLNRFIENLGTPPGFSDIRLLYATQYTVNPPSFAVFVNDVRLVKTNFRRFVENRLREAFDFNGTPVRLSFKGRKRPK
ncbi:MAG: ribosome biogenesis GTPase Der [Candidatus Latescibacteria bacterium]|nr:ribosome biogenesis GTPase Der [Candidatus Latescibacterota bacterium]